MSASSSAAEADDVRDSFKRQHEPLFNLSWLGNPVRDILPLMSSMAGDSKGSRLLDGNYFLCRVVRTPTERDSKYAYAEMSESEGGHGPFRIALICAGPNAFLLDYMLPQLTPDALVAVKSPLLNITPAGRARVRAPIIVNSLFNLCVIPCANQNHPVLRRAPWNRDVMGMMTGIPRPKPAKPGDELEPWELPLALEPLLTDGRLAALPPAEAAALVARIGAAAQAHHTGEPAPCGCQACRRAARNAAEMPITRTVHMPSLNADGTLGPMVNVMEQRMEALLAKLRRRKERGNAAFNRGDYQAAFKHYHEDLHSLEETYKDDKMTFDSAAQRTEAHQLAAVMHQNAGIALMHLHDPRHAQSHFTCSLGIRSGVPKVHWLRSGAFLALRDYDACIEDLLAVAGLASWEPVTKEQLLQRTEIVEAALTRTNNGQVAPAIAAKLQRLRQRLGSS